MIDTLLTLIMMVVGIVVAFAFYMQIKIDMQDPAMMGTEFISFLFIVFVFGICILLEIFGVTILIDIWFS